MSCYLTVFLVAAGLLALSVVIAFLLVQRRRVFYARAIAYDVRADYELPDVARILELTPNSSDELTWLGEDTPCGAALLEIEIEARGGGLLDPLLETHSGDLVRRHYFERGARGKRFLNVTEQVRRAAQSSGRLKLRAKNCKFRVNGVRLHVFDEVPEIVGPILVLAPHPDDAEIAAFGLIARHDSWVATITVGDNGPSHYAAFFDSTSDAYLEKARVRVWDSLNIPQLAGVPAGQICNLGYFDGLLPKMATQRDSAVWGEHTGSRDISHLRRVPFDSDVPVREATWHNLVKDIQQLLRLARPAAIVAPHPQVDPHGDHRFTTIAALEALEKSGWSGKLLLYANHVVGSELYPYGPRDGVITVPPLRKDIVFSGMLSIELDRVQVLRKQLAIEAQHDLQPAPSDAMPTMGRAMRSALRDVYCGMVVPDNDYVRRAARRNELYFVVDSSEAAELKRRSLQDS